MEDITDNTNYEHYSKFDRTNHTDIFRATLHQTSLDARNLDFMKDYEQMKENLENNINNLERNVLASFENRNEPTFNNRNMSENSQKQSPKKFESPTKLKYRNLFTLKKDLIVKKFLKTIELLNKELSN